MIRSSRFHSIEVVMQRFVRAGLLFVVSPLFVWLGRSPDTAVRPSLNFRRDA